MHPDLSKLMEAARSYGAEVAADGGRVVLGAVPDCAILAVSEDEEKILVSFHYDANPMMVVQTSLLIIHQIEEPAFISSFLADENGMVLYEEEPGFDLLLLNYLRDLVRAREKSTKRFLA